METFIKMREQLLAKSGGDTKVAWARAANLGIPEGAISLLLKSDAEFKALMQKGKENAMTDEESKSAYRIGQSFTDLGQKMASLSYVIMTDLEPTILKFNTWLSNAATWIEQKLTAKGFQGTAQSIVHKVLGIPDNPKDWGEPVDLTSASDFATSISKFIMNDIPSFFDTFKSMDFFNGSLDDFLDENRFKNNPNLGNDLIDRFQLSPVNNNQTSTNNNSSSSTNVGEIKIYTQSQDQAGEIAGKLGYLFASQSNTALS
jgi:hypothetical protein